MKRLLPLLGLLLLTGCNKNGGFGLGPRNPFGLADVPGSPEDADVKNFAKSARLSGDDRDGNASQWSPQATSGKADSMEGEWFGRWLANVQGRATIKIANARMYIKYEEGPATWLVELVRVGSTDLMGRWVNIANSNDQGFYAGKMVGHDRIDGVWTGDGARWDFRRKLK